MTAHKNQRTLSLSVDTPSGGQTSYLLHQLEVFNWGPFSGLHRAEFDRDGTAIIGPTGSGKTTLVDALVTLLVEFPRYNLASTGGHESDRTLISYVRGVLGGDGANGQEEIARPGKTITAICATYQTADDTLRLAGLLWTDGTGGSSQDLKRRWVFSQADDQTLETWLRQLHDDGLRSLTKLSKETAGLRLFESKKAYLAHVRKFFDVSDNAFTLLNRAAGLKQLNSIDEIFRELVLDDRSAFERAIEVAGEFDNLAAIHEELETARRQQKSLEPVEQEFGRLQKAQAKAHELEKVKRLVPAWYAMTGVRLWQQKRDRIADELQASEAKRDQARQEEQDRRSRVETLLECYLTCGGNVINALETTIALQRQLVSDRRKHADDYDRAAKRLGLPAELNRSALEQNQAQLTSMREEVQQQWNKQDEVTLQGLSRQREQEEKAAGAEALLRKVRERPGSNIPPQFQDFRMELAHQLGVQDGDLPFLAELVEVKTEQADWRGAVERAIGSERLRILVPEQRLQLALDWINARHNRLHVRLQRAKTNDQPGQSLEDGFVRKLNFKPHPLEMTARRMLAGRDRHCVDSAKALQRVEHGLTVEGMMSGQGGRFEKQDQHPLHENWMTGFDNKDQLQALAAELLALKRSIAESQSACEGYRRQLHDLTGRLAIIDRLVSLEFETIDLPGAEAELKRSEEKLASLLDPLSDAGQAKVEYEAECGRLKTVQERIREFDAAIAVSRHEQNRAETERAKAEKRAGRGLSDDEQLLAEATLAIPPSMTADALADAERVASQEIDERLVKQSEQVSDRERDLVRLMGLAQRVDSGALADVGTELDDINAYLDRLRILNEEALPEKRQRFLEYLNRSSDQGVTQLLAGIEEEVDAIEQRISELNQTLVRIEFRNSRYLQLQPQRIKDERVRTLEAAQRHLRSAALKDDQGESHFKALRNVVDILREAADNRRQIGSRALLDPRYRLQFFVVEVDWNTGDRSPPRTGSQSGSGGEKELMASHILTASLSYALCPADSAGPLYATVVLDEAFSKSSPSAANRIIEALRHFRLHPIFVTPNKEIGLLKQHTRKVICVQRPKKEASLASISWEVLEEYANP